MNRTATRSNNERVTNEETRRQMADNIHFGPRKTLIVLAIVAGCFAVLWPKILYPMLNGPVNTVSTPMDVPACCDLVFTSDVNTVDIMQEMCKNILRHHQVDPRVRDALKSSKLTPQSASLCREEVLARCGIDLSSFLAEKERLGKTYKQVLEEIRSFNSSLCLKRQFGVPLSQLGTPHLIRYHILMPHSPIRQERRTPPHAGGLHPAMRERGRAIPSSHIVPKVDGRPDHVIVQKMRPPLGAAGRVVPAPTGSTGMGIIMPLYSLGIIIFFLYTIVKVMRKSSDNVIYAEYQNLAAEREFRNRVFNPEVLSSALTGMPYYRKDRPPSPVRPTPTIEELKEQAAGDIEIDQLRQRLVDTEAAMERIVVQMGSLSRTVVHSPSPQRDTQLQDECTSRSSCSRNHNGIDEHDDSSSTVKVMGMEMTACCEGGQKISRPTTPIIPQAHSYPERELTPPKPIYLEGALPPQCELLVTDSETQAENSEDDTEAPVVLSGKMTLSLISHDQTQAETEDQSLDAEESYNGIEEIAAVVATDNYSSLDAVMKLTEKSDSAEIVDHSEEESESEEVDDEDEDEVDEELEVDDEDEDEVDEELEEDDSEEEIETDVSEQSEEVEVIDTQNKETGAVEHVKNVEKNVSAINTDDTDEDSEEEEDEVSEEVEDVDDSDDEESAEESEEDEDEDEEEVEVEVEFSDGSDASDEVDPKQKS